MIKEIKKQIRKGTAYEDACKVLGVEPLTRETYNYLPQKEGDYDYSDHRIKRVADAMNKITGYEANYRDTNQRKCFPVFWFSASGWSLYGSGCDRGVARVGSRHTVGSLEESNYLAELMKDDYAVIHNAKE